jgi:hypothetical protein
LVAAAEEPISGTMRAHESWLQQIPLLPQQEALFGRRRPDGGFPGAAVAHGEKVERITVGAGSGQLICRVAVLAGSSQGWECGT